MCWARCAVKSSRFFLQGNRTRPSYLAHSSRYPRPLHLPSTNGISRAYASSNHQCGNCRADGTECGLVVWFRHSRQRPQLHRLQPQRTGRRNRLARLHRLPVQDRRRLPPGPPRHRRGREAAIQVFRQLVREATTGNRRTSDLAYHLIDLQDAAIAPRGGKNTAPGARTRVGDEARHLRVPMATAPPWMARNPARTSRRSSMRPFSKTPLPMSSRGRCGRGHGRAGGAHRRARGGGRRNRHRGRLRRARAAAGGGNGSTRGSGASRVPGECGAVRQGSGCRGHRRLRRQRQSSSRGACRPGAAAPPALHAADATGSANLPSPDAAEESSMPPSPSPRRFRTRAGTGIGQGPQPVAAPPGAARTPGRRRGRGRRQRGAHPGRRRHSPTRG